MSVLVSHGSLELSIKSYDTLASVTENEQNDESVELIINQTTESNASIKDEHKLKHISVWRTVFMLFVICCVDMITVYCMNSIFHEATTTLSASQLTHCVYELQYLSNSLNVIIAALCLISTLILAVSALNLYSKQNAKLSAIIIYWTAIVIHSILFWYENILISNIQSHRTTTCVIIGIDANMTIIRYALMVKGILFTLVFVATFMYNLCLKLLSNRNLNKQRCAIFIIFSLSLIILISLIFVTVDAYIYNGIHIIHGIGALLGLFHIKCHAIKGIDTHHLTTTYNANYKSEYKDEYLQPCCPGGICCHKGNGGCCEWKFKGGFCVVCYGGCGDYPKSLCFSCCGMCSCFCCDPGGCYGAICCSYDFCTWCGCGCC